ncbi:malonyl-ACP O-methyltransferase BioC [Caviibacterium pharyngocola]|uniref:Malonyl-[acyl-carrier protein] O-methyltransferase n=1 Tax=Caviibacterium pharyngocola TaxID=28159 RepID=A0A2M8RXQ0_9PAST|nr:malonyl-ACP O-methyltransferase BioC [Caviibacterium pharyngocola]PJG83667.1 malonyl-[acyl-carrier protein] O-methyltransferase BioC [Caviibacterium pharyngocola]
MLTHNKDRICRCFSQALTTYDEQAQAQQQINRRLTDILLAQGARQFARLLEIGCGTGQLTRLLCAELQVEQWHLNDLCRTEPQIAEILHGQDYRFYCADAEHYTFPAQYDLIVSASAVQWFDDPLDFVTRSRALLKPDGYLLFSTFAPQNLAEIRALTSVGLNYPHLQQWQDALQKDFKVLHLQQQNIRLIFSSPLAVLQHLKATGVTAVGQGHWTKTQLQQFSQDYRHNFADSAGKVRLTYQPIFVLAQKQGEKTNDSANFICFGN